MVKSLCPLGVIFFIALTIFKIYIAILGKQKKEKNCPYMNE